jgi:DNA/RNA endonuclease G (NUC1)
MNYWVYTAPDGMINKFTILEVYVRNRLLPDSLKYNLKSRQPVPFTSLANCKSYLSCHSHYSSVYQAGRRKTNITSWNLRSTRQKYQPLDSDICNSAVLL